MSLNPVLAELMVSEQIRFPDGDTTSLFPNSITAPIGFALAKLVKDLRPATSLEIGLGFGISALFICETLGEKAKHVVIDPYQNREVYRGMGLANLERAGHLEKVEFHETFSHVALPRLHESGRKFEFAFVDGNHTFDHVMLDFFYVDLMLEIGGLVVFDDVDFPSLKKLCSFIEANRSYEHVMNLEDLGELRAKAYRKKAHDSRDFTFHRDF